MSKNNLWNVGIYIRLSVEDGDDKIESNSITNQRRLLNMYVSNEVDLAFYDEYVDDGFSGTTFNRPGFQKMLTDIKNGKINTIVVKDLSRLGRNYIEVGNYIEQIFPLYNIRFIAINDNIDSYKDPSSINNVIVPFKNLMNDEYCRDISNKVKSSLLAKKRKGEYVGSGAIYGYMLDPNDKHHLIIDEEAAIVVRDIYKMSLEGKGKHLIAKTLNDRGVLPPSIYKEKKTGKKRPRKNDKVYWTADGISKILKNEMYCGDMIQGKGKMISYKIHKPQKVPKEEWIIVRNTHEAIIDRDTFAKVQEAIKSRDTKVDNTGTLYVLSGFLRCNDCKHTMTKKLSRSKMYQQETGKRRFIFYCSYYVRSFKEQCSKHSIRSDVLEEMVLKSIQLQIDLILKSEKTIDEITKSKNINYNNQSLRKSIDELEKRLNKLKLLKKSVYEDWKLNIITQEEYNSYSVSYNDDIQNINNSLNTLKEKLNNNKNINNNSWINEFRKRKNIKELDRDTIESLIDYIDICEDGNIIITFKYNDEYKNMINFIKENS